jgi:hypothetical protein
LACIFLEGLIAQAAQIGPDDPTPECEAFADVLLGRLQAAMPRAT